MSISESLKKSVTNILFKIHYVRLEVLGVVNNTVRVVEVLERRKSFRMRWIILIVRFIRRIGAIYIVGCRHLIQHTC